MSAQNKDFKERVKEVLIQQAQPYKEYYVQYEYLVFSDAFKNKKYYIIDAHEDNYMHLGGIASHLTAKDFFNKCINGTLSENDFNFIKKGQSEKAVKGSVRRKIKVLPNIINLFNSKTKVEEDFSKNTIKCSFAIGDNICTLGFVDASKGKPKTLLAGNELDDTKSKHFKLVLRKKRGDKLYNEMVVGEKSVVNALYPEIKDLIDDKLIK